MGEKGATRGAAAAETAIRFTDSLAALGEVHAKKMFGGQGIFCDGVMVGLVDPKGTAHLRGDDSTAAADEAAGGERHGRMPYWSVPAGVLADEAALLARARRSLEISRAAKS